MSDNKNETGGTSAPAPSPAKLDRKPRLAPKAQDLLQDRTGGLPVWIRAPKNGPCQLTGFSRSKLYDMASKGLIRSVSIREPGQTKGTRLFHLESTLDYIGKCESAAMEGNA